MAPVITRIINHSLATGEFSPQLKRSIITPLLKKPSLDKEHLLNFSISNFSVTSKNVERIVESRITDHLTRNQVFDGVQSAYCTNFIPLKLPFSLHDHRMNTIVHQSSAYSISLLPLTPLIMQLSWNSYLYGLEFMVLHSTSSNPTFQIVYSASGDLSEPQQSCHCLPFGTVLGLTSFTLYATRLSYFLIVTQSLLIR